MNKEAKQRKIEGLTRLHNLNTERMKDLENSKIFVPLTKEQLKTEIYDLRLYLDTILENYIDLLKAE